MLTTIELGACVYVAWIIWKYGLANIEALFYREGLVIPPFLIRAYFFAVTFGDPFQAARKINASPDQDQYWRAFLIANTLMYGFINEDVYAYGGDTDDHAFPEVVASCRDVFYSPSGWKSRREFCALVEARRLQRQAERAAEQEAQERRAEAERARREAEERARAREQERAWERADAFQFDEEPFEKDEWYDILLVDKNASPAEIKKAYRDLLKLYHPDRLLSHPELAKSMTQQLTEAYDTAKRLGKLKRTRA